MGSSDTLRSVIDAGQSSKRLDELSSARVIGKVALQAHAAQQKAGAGKAIGPLTPSRVGFAPGGAVMLEAAETNALGYSAPEQISGSAGDRRSDVFSLGAVMWEALTHQRLFDAMNDAAVKVAVQDREIQPPSEINANIPAELSAICMRALARNPTDRYQSLKAMSVEIEEFLEEAGETDDDGKIAQFIGAMPRKPAPGQQPTSGTLPPPLAQRLPLAKSADRLPSILTAEPERLKSSSGSALAAALANAEAPATAGGSNGRLPAASASATAIGIPAAPVASDWQDSTPPPVAPLGGVTQPMPQPLTPRPPVLPTGSQSTLRNEKATISVSVPPQVKVSTTTPTSTIEAKHVEAKPAAQIVEDKPAAQIVDDPVEAAVAAVMPPAEVAPAAKPIDDARATLVDTTPPGLINAAADAKAAADKAEAAKAESVKAETAKAGAAKAETAKAEAAKAEAAKADVADNATKLEPAKDPGTADTERVKKGTGPHPAAVVSLSKTGRESKADLLAGWGWGTGNHDALPPSAYASDEDEYPPPNSKKVLTYVIGGGLALALLVVVIAFAAGGSSKKAKPSAKQLAAEKAKKEAELAAAQQPAPPPERTVVAPAGSAAPVVDEAAKAAADKAAADKAAEDKLAADKAAADQAAADKAVAEKAEREAKMSAAERNKADAAQAKLDTEAAKKAEADRKKAEVAQAKLDAEAAKKAEADKRAESRRVAQDEAAAKKAEADAAKKAEAAKNPTTTATKTTTTKTPDTKRPDTKTTAATKTVATADKTTTAPKSDVNPETAYRQGLQAFARGDTAAALASLRSSLAANPNYAPTWRGLGLVFEKMGEKEQAKAAYRRYLQLVPTAGDSEIIRGRLERLTL